MGATKQTAKEGSTVHTGTSFQTLPCEFTYVIGEHGRAGHDPPTELLNCWLPPLLQRTNQTAADPTLIGRFTARRFRWFQVGRSGHCRLWLTSILDTDCEGQKAVERITCPR